MVILAGKRIETRWLWLMCAGLSHERGYAGLFHGTELAKLFVSG